MPEGDTIARAARTLDRWLAGRTLTAASTTVEGVPADTLVGTSVESVEARGKHLLVHLSDGRALHTHMRMTGSWHVYPAGERWRKPATDARVVLVSGDRVAVCFDAPVVELLRPRAAPLHPALSRLGPDVLRPPIDLDEVRRRAGTRAPATPVGELLLDQQVVAGIGNIWRCETLFARRVSPWMPLGALAPDELDAIVTTAGELMRRSVTPRGSRPRPQVYGRARRPCPRCRTPVAVGRIGEHPRSVYWCPSCQPAPAPDVAVAAPGTALQRRPAPGDPPGTRR